MRGGGSSLVLPIGRGKLSRCANSVLIVCIDRVCVYLYVLYNTDIVNYNERIGCVDRVCE